METCARKILRTASRQVGTISSLRGKKAIAQVGTIPITVNVTDLIVVKERDTEEG